MAVLNTGLAKVSGGYTIDQSLRFNDDDSAYLSRTPSSAGNKKTWTWSGWVKRGSNLNLDQDLFGVHDGSSNITKVYFLADQKLQIEYYNGSTNYYIRTNQLFRDVSAFYHIVAIFDTTQSTEANRLQLWVNGERITSLSNDVQPTLNFDGYVNDATKEHSVGRRAGNDSEHLDGYLAEVHFVDGQALTPASFGETDEDYGHWKPTKYTGTYGTNGFYLDFSDSAALGDDAAGSNDWTVNNLTASSQVLDSCTNNFATMNPLYRNQTVYLGGTGQMVFSEGNLKTTSPNGTGGAGYTHSKSTMMVTYNTYAEGYIVAIGGTGQEFGLSAESFAGGTYGTLWEDQPHLFGDGNVRLNGSNSVDIGTIAVGDVLGIAVNPTTETFWISHNGVWSGTGTQNPATPAGGFSYSYLNENVFIAVGDGSATGVQVTVLNFGQDSSFAGEKTSGSATATDSNSIGDFYYTPPSGYLALCTQNLPEPTVIPSEHFNTVLWTGDDSSSNAITGVGFNPDLVWTKARSYARHHWWFDKVRGAEKWVQSSNTDPEDDVDAGLISFDTDGFTYKYQANNGFNTNNETYASWNWKAGGSGSSNTDGDITSTVSANVDAGFSIVSYTGAGGVSTIGHGLSSKPEMLIVKNRTQSSDWEVYVEPLGNSARMVLNSTAAESTGINGWDSTSPTNTVFTINGGVAGNTSGDNHIAYCFHSVEGFSKCGEYTGNGSSSDGTFVYTGFRVAMLLQKRVDSADSWHILDNKRSPSNVVDDRLYPNSSSAESTSGDRADFTSNGFKLRDTNGDFNASGGTYIYLAFAETPFSKSNAR